MLPVGNHNAALYALIENSKAQDLNPRDYLAVRFRVLC